MVTVPTMDEALLSSPDPLNDEPMYSSPAKTRPNTRRRSVSMSGSSPRKQTFELDVGNNKSPQKLRVTVEADTSDKENGYRVNSSGKPRSPTKRRAPVIRRNERTTTTTIPVKGLEDSSDVESDHTPVQTPKRGRGRPRKSAGTPVRLKSNVRSSTPGGRRRKTLGDLVDGDDEEDWDFRIGSNVELGRGKGRSRSRAIKSAKATPATRGQADAMMVSTETRKTRGRRKSLAPEEVIILQDESEPEINDISEETAVQSEKCLSRDHERHSSPNLPPAAAMDEQRSSLDSWRHESRDDSLQLPHGERIETKSNDEDHANAVDEDDGGYRDFDTIMESEGFSMISVDSVPSLREHFSSPFIQEAPMPQPVPKPASAAVNRTLQAVQAADDSFSSIPPEILDAATPARPTRYHDRLSNQTSASDKIVSSTRPSQLPVDLQDLGQPIRKCGPTPTSVNEPFSSVPRSILDAATPRPQLRNKLFKQKFAQKSNHDDSFSSIPSAVLEAATPARQYLTVVDQRSPLEGNTTIESVQLIAAHDSTNSQSQVRDSSRMLTPDETPSPKSVHNDQASHHHELRTAQSGSQPETSTVDCQADLSSNQSQMRSSPPPMLPGHFTYTDTFQEHKLMQDDRAETPSILFSSPKLPPRVQPQPARAQKAGDGSLPKQALLPIVRAGRALQDIVVPTLSPRSRSQSLGSPFKSPVSQRRSDSMTSAIRPPAEELPISALPSGQVLRTDNRDIDAGIYGGFSSGTRRELRDSFAAGQHLANTQPIPAVAVPEDPFRSVGSIAATPASSRSRTIYRLGRPGRPQHLYQPPKSADVSAASSMRSDSAMSWQANSPMILAHVESNSALKVHSSGSGKSREISNMNESQAESQPKNCPRSSELNVPDVRPANSVAVSKDSCLGSDLQKVAAVEHENSEEEADDDMDIWLEEAKNSSQLEGEDEATRKPPDHIDDASESPANKPRRSKIPSTWRQNSKRLVYSDEISKPSPVSVTKENKSRDTIIVESTQTAFFEARSLEIQKLANSFSSYPASREIEGISESSELADCSQMLPIPQKANFAPRVRARVSGNLDLSALLGSSPMKPDKFQVTLQDTQQRQHLRDEENLQTAISRPLFAVDPAARPSVQDRINEILSQEEPDTNGEQTLSTEESYSEDHSDAPATPPASSSSLIYPLLNNVRPILPSAQTPSPKKGLLRASLPGQSPIKNVVWVGLSSSPESKSLVEASTRDITEQELSASDQILSRGLFARITPTPQEPVEDSLAGSSPATPMTPIPPQLSSTTWSKAHWKLLESIFLDVRSSLPLAAELEQAYQSSKLLGKNVLADGEKMKIEAWHLDVVACFLDEVPGWDEARTITRVFGLVKGEERRQRAKRERRAAREERSID